ncbi:MAG: RidA family protein [Acidobacteria bacterium]|nr:RidA family protein [Acidobacteriota bacterium]
MPLVNPASLARPRGFSHGIVAEGRMLFVAGQIGWDAEGRIVSDRFDEQFDQALANALAVVTEAGGTAASVCRLTIYVVDKAEYVNAQKAIGERYRARMGRHYPAMTLVEVRGLLEPGARVEIEATAAIA